MTGKRTFKREAEFVEISWSGAQVEVKFGVEGGEVSSLTHAFEIDEARDAFVRSRVAKLLREGFVERQRP